MSHVDSIIDSDKHFIINPVTRTITTECEKLILVQLDHNSERYTFDIPRIIDGHDMSTCNLVEIHFDNMTSNKVKTSSDFYTVTDLHVSENDDSMVEFSWLISDSATQNVGPLSFSICFKCIAEDGTIEYAWHTTEFNDISIIKTKHNTEHVLTKISDFVTRMEAIVATIPTKLSDLKNDLVFTSIPCVDVSTSTVYELYIDNGKVILKEKEETI